MFHFPRYLEGPGTSKIFQVSCPGRLASLRLLCLYTGPGSDASASLVDSDLHPGAAGHLQTFIMPL